MLKIISSESVVITNYKPKGIIKAITDYVIDYAKQEQNENSQKDISNWIKELNL